MRGVTKASNSDREMRVAMLTLFILFPVQNKHKPGESQRVHTTQLLVEVKVDIFRLQRGVKGENYALVPTRSRLHTQRGSPHSTRLASAFLHTIFPFGIHRTCIN